MNTPSPLRFAIAGCLVLSLLGGGAALWGSRQLARAEQQNARLASRLAALSQTRDRQTEFAARLEPLQSRWQRLRQSGFFEAETHSPRLGWTSTLRTLQHELKLSTLHPRWNTAEPLPIAVPGVRFLRRRGTLTLELDHALLLPRLFSALSAHTPALIRLHGCTLRRNPLRAEATTPGPNLLAECELEWVSARLETPPEITP